MSLLLLLLGEGAVNRRGYGANVVAVGSGGGGGIDDNNILSWLPDCLALRVKTSRPEIEREVCEQASVC